MALVILNRWGVHVDDPIDNAYCDAFGPEGACIRLIGHPEVDHYSPGMHVTYDSGHYFSWPVSEEWDAWRTSA